MVGKMRQWLWSKAAVLREEEVVPLCGPTTT